MFSPPDICNIKVVSKVLGNVKKNPYQPKPYFFKKLLWTISVIIVCDYQLLSWWRAIIIIIIFFTVFKYYIYHGSYVLTYLNQRIRRMSWLNKFMSKIHGNIWFVTEIKIGWFRRDPQNHGRTSKSWNNIKIFMLDHGL